MSKIIAIDGAARSRQVLDELIELTQLNGNLEAVSDEGRAILAMVLNIVCTSGMKWADASGQRIVFIPPEMVIENALKALRARAPVVPEAEASEAVH